MTAKAFILASLSAQPMTAGDLISRSPYSAGYLRRLLCEMCETGEIKRNQWYGGAYYLPKRG